MISDQATLWIWRVDWADGLQRTSTRFLALDVDDARARAGQLIEGLHPSVIGALVREGHVQVTEAARDLILATDLRDSFGFR